MTIAKPIFAVKIFHLWGFYLSMFGQMAILPDFLHANFWHSSGSLHNIKQLHQCRLHGINVAFILILNSKQQPCSGEENKSNCIRSFRSSWTKTTQKHPRTALSTICSTPSSSAFLRLSAILLFFGLSFNRPTPVETIASLSSP